MAPVARRYRDDLRDLIGPCRGWRRCC